MIAVYIFISLIGFIPFLVVLYKIRKVKDLKKHGVKTTGTVLQVDRKTSNMSTVTVRYFMEDGRHYADKAVPVAGSPYEVGQKLPLYYDRQNPHNMQFDSGKAFILIIIFTVLLAAFCIAACFLIDNSIAKGEL